MGETFSEIIGSQLRPLETSIEDHFDQMSSNHSESQQSIQSLSHSISSLASQVSQLLENASLSDPNRENSPKVPEVPIPNLLSLNMNGVAMRYQESMMLLMTKLIFTTANTALSNSLNLGVLAPSREASTLPIVMHSEIVI